MCKGHREDPIQVGDMESDREWSDIKIEAYNQPLQPRFTQTASGAEALHQVILLAAGRTLGMTLRFRRGGGDSGVVKVGLGVVEGFGLLRIQIFGYCGIWVSYL